MAERLAVLLPGEVVGHLDRGASDDEPTFFLHGRVRADR